MRISELSDASGVPVATIKYYLREGLLPTGRIVAATRAEYDESHVRRLAIIRALIDVAGLPVARVRDILRLIDAPGDDLFSTVGRVIGALPPYVDAGGAGSRDAGGSGESGRSGRSGAGAGGEPYPRARAAIARLGWTWDERFTAVAQLERALAAAESSGIPLTDERLRAYGRAMHAVAEAELDERPDGPSDFLAYAVVGTALYEPVLLALRRLAHQDVSARTIRSARSRR